MTSRARATVMTLTATASVAAMTLALTEAAPADSRAGAPTATAAAVKSVSLRGVAFSPKTVRISRGDSVRFFWRDNGIVHNVTPVGSRSFKFVIKDRTRSSTGDRRSGAVSTTRFTRNGTYRYVCTIHATPDENGRFPSSAMTGKIIVG